MELLLVGIGGIFGSIARFSIGKLITEKSNNSFPFGTFIINISGAFLLGIVASMDFSRNYYLTLAEGFLGAYTTFSTFMYEGFNLFNENKKLNAFVYVLGSLLIGILGFVAGVSLGDIFNYRYIHLFSNALHSIH